MELNKLVEKMISDYPYLYGHRNQVLHYIYCVLPNEFIWKNGKIFCENFLESNTITQRIDKHLKMFPDNIKEELISEEYEEMKDLKNGKFYIFPLTKQCNLYNIPNNVSKDYLDGAYEIINILKGMDKDYHKIYTRQEEQNYYYKNILIISEIDKNLIDRF